MRRLIFAMFLVIGLVGCGGDDDSGIVAPVKGFTTISVTSEPADSVAIVASSYSASDNSGRGGTSRSPFLLWWELFEGEEDLVKICVSKRGYARKCESIVVVGGIEQNVHFTLELVKKAVFNVRHLFYEENPTLIHWTISEISIRDDSKGIYDVSHSYNGDALTYGELASFQLEHLPYVFDVNGGYSYNVKVVDSDGFGYVKNDVVVSSDGVVSVSDWNISQETTPSFLSNLWDFGDYWLSFRRTGKWYMYRSPSGLASAGNPFTLNGHRVEIYVEGSYTLNGNVLKVSGQKKDSHGRIVRKIRDSGKIVDRTSRSFGWQIGDEVHRLYYDSKYP